MAAGRDQDTLIIAFHAAGSNGVLAALWNTGTQVTLRAVDPCVVVRTRSFMIEISIGPH